MRRIMLASLLVASCSGGSDQGNDTARTKGGGAVQTATLTGLYEGGPAARRNQMCVVEDGGKSNFALIVWGANLHSCAGSGEAVREGNVLRLTMAGDESCTIEAATDGRRVTMPASVPEGCGYYCGPQANLVGATLDKTGGTPEDAMKAKDLVGDPLCGGLSAAP